MELGQKQKEKGEVGVCDGRVNTLLNAFGGHLRQSQARKGKSLYVNLLKACHILISKLCRLNSPAALAAPLRNFEYGDSCLSVDIRVISP